jgi:hypothetical protein
MSSDKDENWSELAIISDIQKHIFTIRGVQVMVDRDLATLFKVGTKDMNRSVKRNIERFPVNFRFQIDDVELQYLRCQFGTSSEHGGRRYLPYVFTEQGIAMLSAVLRSQTAVKVSIQIMQAFVDMRKFIASNGSLLYRMDKVEQKQLETDHKFEEIFCAIESDVLRKLRG